MLYESKLTFMQRLQQAAGNGYYHYITGHIEREKFDTMARKFAQLYESEISRQSKARRKRAGAATSTLFAMQVRGHPQQDQSEQLWFVLMATEGVGRVHVREQLQDLRQKQTRLTMLDGHHQLIHDGVSWTWQMTPSHLQKYRERIHLIAALPPHRRRIIELDDIPRDLSIERLQDQLYGEPGFRLVRRQVGLLVKYLRAEWKRLRPAAGPQPRQISYLPYIRFRPNKQAK